MPSVPDDRDGLARVADAPAARDQLARHAAAEEVAEIGREKRHPEAHQALLELEALRHEIDREPVGDEEPHRIGEASWRGCSPTSGGRREQRAVRQCRAPSWPRVAHVGAVRQDVVALLGRQPRVIFGPVVEARGRRSARRSRACRSAGTPAASCRTCDRWSARSTARARRRSTSRCRRARPPTRFRGRGNHSETALVAPGQLPASPRPSANRNAAKLRSPVASDVAIAAIEYHTTARLRPARVPERDR